ADRWKHCVAFARKGLQTIGAKFMLRAMILREFISKSLLDIKGALDDVQKKSPGLVITKGISTRSEFVQLGVTHLQAVDFEVMVRVDEQSGSEAKLNVVAAIIGGNVKGESGKAEGHSATLRFRIPI